MLASAARGSAPTRPESSSAAGGTGIVRRSAVQDFGSAATTAPQRPFPPDFVWGASSAAYQIEGETGDHLDRFRDVADLLRSLGLTTYRFTASWTRVRPEAGPVSQRGLDRYRRLTDTLLQAGITPWINLHHRDLPQNLAREGGGWANRDTAYRFLDHALTMYDALGDRVPLWTTLHEPGPPAFAGAVAVHHLLLGHGLAIQELRRRGASPAHDRRLGISLALSSASDTDDPANRLFLEPLLHGRYAEDLTTESAGPTNCGPEWQGWVLDGDRDLIGQQLDLVGVSYHPATACSAGSGGLARLLVRLRDEYAAPPLYVTGGGTAYDGASGADGPVDDRLRLTSLREHLIAIHDALDAGVDVRGYLARDLVQVGLAGARTPTASARWYAGVAATGRI